MKEETVDVFCPDDCPECTGWYGDAAYLERKAQLKPYRRWVDVQGIDRQVEIRVRKWFPHRPECKVCLTSSRVRNGLCSECTPLVGMARWSNSARVILEARWDKATEETK